MRKIGKIIRRYRMNRNLTQEDVANHLSVPKQTVADWEADLSLPDLETANRLMDFLDIHPVKIFGRPTRQKRLLLGLLIAAVCIAAAVPACVIGARMREQARIEAGYLDGINQAHQFAEDVTMVQLLATPERYHGKLIRVIGVGNLEFEVDCISLSKEVHEFFTGDSIWIALGPRALPYEEAQAYNGKYVIVEGIFDMYSRGHFSMFQGTIRDVSRYQLWESDAE